MALQDSSGLYATLFKIAWQVMQNFAANHKFLGAKTGMVAILHTWGGAEPEFTSLYREEG